MSLIEEDMQRIDAVLADGPGKDGPGGTIAGLRRMLPGLHVMRCDASDVLETPFRSYGEVDLHLIDGQGHCAQLTTDPRRATGLLLAFKALAA